jgi:hypothetical protein
VRREHITFEEFKEHFIDHPDGYFSVYSAFAERHDDGSPLRRVELDMICEWRMSDAKVRFLSVEFSTEDEFDQIVEYLKLTAKMLHDAIVKRVDEMDFADVMDADSEDDSE